MGLNTWTRSGSEKAQSSQTIRILLKSLQYLAEDVASDDARERSFINVASQVIKSTFVPSTEHSVNEQVSIVFQSMGWKNSQVKLTSADEAEILLGSNRHLDQEPETVEGLRVLIKTISKALGSHIFDRDVDAIVDIDIHTGPTYNIKLRAIQKMQDRLENPTQKPPTTQPTNSTPSSSVSSSTSTGQNSIPPPIKPIASSIETSQIFLPILSSKLAPSRLHLILQDVLVEFAKSWYGENPIASNPSDDERENVITLVTYLANQALENDTSRVEVGSQIGNYFAGAIKDTFQGEELVSPEILDGSAVGSIIRDIKARAFCYLKPGEKCGSEIGGENREICDFAMGLWQGCLSVLMEDKEFKFTNYYPAGRRDPYCLMEFEVKSME